LGLEREHVRVMAMDLPEAKGTYVLIASVVQMKRLEIGRLGAYDIVPGFYAYVGSALGSGGLRARLGHHLESTASPHWHIDYLLGVAEPVEVWYTTAHQKLEHQWAELLQEAPHFRVPIPRFGSSDYHRSRLSHLFHSKRRPSFGWFEQAIRESRHHPAFNTSSIWRSSLWPRKSS
jgi:Uri superfamily endonuclease